MCFFLVWYITATDGTSNMRIKNFHFANTSCSTRGKVLQVMSPTFNWVTYSMNLLGTNLWSHPVAECNSTYATISCPNKMKPRLVILVLAKTCKMTDMTGCFKFDTRQRFQRPASSEPILNIHIHHTCHTGTQSVIDGCTVSAHQCAHQNSILTQARKQVFSRNAPTHPVKPIVKVIKPAMKIITIKPSVSIIKLTLKTIFSGSSSYYLLHM